MTATLVLPSHLEEELAGCLANPIETAGVILARLIEGPHGLRILARGIHWVEDSGYLERSPTHMRITASGYVPALGSAEQDGCMAIWFHSHPSTPGSPFPSKHDARVDAEIADLFRLRTGAERYATLIFAPGEAGYEFTGSVESASGERLPIERIWSVGARWSLRHSADSDATEPDTRFDRNILAFGPAIQRTLGDLAVSVIGSGGTGSAVAEQLVRLGVRNLLLVDADRLSLSNVTRVYGSTPADEGRLKVEVLRDHLLRIAPELHCEILPQMATLESTARRLAFSDVIFGCTDDNAGRLVLSRLSTYFLLPVMDVGVLLSSGPDGLLAGIDGRVTTMTPGAACLVCRNRIDLKRAADEVKTPDERRRLADEGYAPALGQTEPAVVAFTTAVAAAAVNELLDRLIGYGPPARPTETLLRLHEREMSSNNARPRDHHYCHQAKGKWGAGQGDANFMDQLWPDE